MKHGSAGRQAWWDEAERGEANPKGAGLRYSAARYSIGKHTYKCYTPGGFRYPSKVLHSL